MGVKLVHGIRSLNKGRATMRGLRDVLRARGRDAQIVAYGYVLVPLSNSRAINAVQEAVKPGDVVVGYSNGAWAAVQAAEMGSQIRHLVLVSPALHKSHAFPEHIDRIDVLFDPDDTPVLLARWWRKFTRIFPWRWRKPHGWGEMGRTGYVGNDPRVHNHRLPKGTGHGWFASADAIVRVANVVSV